MLYFSKCLYMDSFCHLLFLLIIFINTVIQRSSDSNKTQGSPVSQRTETHCHIQLRDKKLRGPPYARGGVKCPASMLVSSRGRRRGRRPKERDSTPGHLENGTPELSISGLQLWNLQRLSNFLSCFPNLSLSDGGDVV